ncbi:MAG: hypothetical protein P4L85_04045 [Paludisphaera borealis]|uniref:hypothetical protein n=1 Tax=Paludisphaera borealis TaxID=1387353 RepID=UPI002845EE9E|nr:hypothetical protein [Paludisphaera borealis]MDR3618499.1 hypothetical protein [Paludisphaera borealis]
MAKVNRKNAAAGQAHVRPMVRIRFCFALVVLLVAAQSGSRALASDADEASRATRDLKEILWAFPADTQTIMAARGPFKIETADADAGPGPIKIHEMLQQVVLGLPPGFIRTEAGKDLAGCTVTVAVLGSKQFRSPRDLGAVHYVGASIIRLKNDASIVRKLAEGGDRSPRSDVERERIGGHDVLVVNYKAFKDTWTFFISQPDARTIVCSSDRRYLNETLARLQTRAATRALPETSPEWPFVNIEQEFWAVRHYDRADAAEDPTSPLAGKLLEANTLDEFAVGIGCGYSRRDEQFQVAYLSKRPDAKPVVRDMFDLPPDHRLTSRECRDGGHVVQIVLDAHVADGDRTSPAALSALFVLQSLGHATFF